ncbi:hypothetical protein EDD66_101371 [Mobilisporobacter senegalensis]|uniref:Immunity MXAN-0049 protein domain-containing protein n=1 Tax=Mobilisporobacter senegalensis TaxID=1329262 RepID=A0A3N1XYR7_9FIRM|nr:DUF1629 domain-containing protein [Mobilisporobacter senegalensis]ROR31753.1 hypothetical protein EDD66_101371 [Mobilisporobacter senegalensis]
MFYKLVFDMDRIDESIKEGINTIYAETSNIDEIEYKGIKKGFFDNIILSEWDINDWPDVEFYYSSKASELESEYLLNAKSWPIIHKKVMQKFNEEGIKGVEYYPIKLVDVVNKNINNSYVLMYVKNFIDGYDMQKSQYRFNEKYNFYTFIPHEIYLDEKKCSNYDIFRCTKNVAALYVSEKIKRIIEENEWIGFAFYKQKSNLV